jgi:predicted membrane chloride channel (bestrophin family)
LLRQGQGRNRKTGTHPLPCAVTMTDFSSFSENSPTCRYNQARKIAYIPFPFPHAQMTTLFVLVTVGLIPVLMLTYLTNTVFGFALNMLTVMCFTGLHEVARELESPFQNVPNDIPLNNFQGQFNEGLMTMFFAYHPDSYWQVEQDNTVLSDSVPTMNRNEVPGNTDNHSAKVEYLERKESL